MTGSTKNSTQEFNQTKLNDNCGLIIEPGVISDPLNLDTNKLNALFKKHRALYFKGWNMNFTMFQELSARLCKNFSSYEGGGFRFKQLNRDFVNKDKTIMTTTGSTQGFPIPLHGEMHYMGIPPELIWFYCKVPGINTGQTTICDGIALADKLPDDVKLFFTNRNIKYLRFLPDGSWQSTFMTDDSEEAMRLCDAQKVKYSYDESTKRFTTEYVVNPYLTSSDNGKVAFINNILNIAAVEWAFESGWAKKELGDNLGDECPLIVRMENGDRIPEDILSQVRETAESLTHNIDWKEGELLMLDNLSVMHGRRESTSKNREIFVRMGDTNFN